jgi:hypothetical protein
MSKGLRGVELNYAIMDKQAYSLVQALKHFRSYVRYSKMVAFLPHPTMKDILSQ